MKRKDNGEVGLLITEMWCYVSLFGHRRPVVIPLGNSNRKLSTLQYAHHQSRTPEF